jgi:hypothetical protein
MQVNFASNRKIFVFLFCVFVNNYIWFWIPVRALIKLKFPVFHRVGIMAVIAPIYIFQ